MEIKSGLNQKERGAIEFCIACHAGQVDKNYCPYYSHALSVAIACLNGSEDLFIAALLHDVIEDCGVSISFIREKYGDRVADAVDHLSRRSSESYASYIRRVKENGIARRVKLADLADNLLAWRIEALEPKEAARLRKRYLKAWAELSTEDTSS